MGKIVKVMETYVQGYNIRLTRSVTKGDIITVCRNLEIRFSEEYGGEWKFAPEPITEGGIVFEQWPNHLNPQQSWYKTMRIKMGGRQYGKWPWIRDDVNNTWTNEEKDDLIWTVPQNINSQIYSGPNTTYLKAFRGAPIWTLQELKIFDEALSGVGITRNGPYPAAKTLAIKR